jgi:hypothetical protein
VSRVADLPRDFVIEDERSNAWRLADHLGRAVVLLFLRGDW